MTVRHLGESAAIRALIAKPDQCPYCGSTDTEGEGVDVQDDARRAEQEVGCNACGASWYLRWQLNGAAIINPPSTE